MTIEQILRHTTNLGETLQLAIRAAAAAGPIIRDGYGQLLEVEQKDVGDLVSDVDFAADQVISDMLSSGSSWAILSEELHNGTPECDQLWIVDPLDASTAFLMQAGTKYPSVLLAAREGGQTTVGVVYFPLTDEWFYAVRGRGAWCNGRRLICSTPQPLDESWVELNHYGNAAWESADFAELRDRLRSKHGARLVTTNVPYSGVAARIADGTHGPAAAIHDNNPEHVKQAPWDIAAPQLVLEEAGGLFVNLDGSRINPFQAEPFIVAGSGQLAGQILDLILRQPADS